MNTCKEVCPTCKRSCVLQECHNERGILNHVNTAKPKMVTSGLREEICSWGPGIVKVSCVEEMTEKTWERVKNGIRV